MTTSALEQSARLSELLRCERAALADFIVALAALDRKRAWVALGYPSLFNYLRQELGLSKPAAFYRLTAARLLQRHPEILEPLRDGRLCYTTVVELAKVLTTENTAEILPRFFHLSGREAKAVTAELAPAAEVPRRFVVTSTSPGAARATTTAPEAEAAALPLAPRQLVQAPELAVEPAREPVPLQAPVVSPAPVPSPSPGLTVEPKTAELSRIHLTVSRRFLDKLEAARDALSHSHSDASEDEILEVALDLLLARDAKRKGLVARPRREPQPASADTVPAHVRRAVWTRDGGRCQWKLASGGICGSTRQVQLDHVVPRGRGGPSTVENLRCLCRPPDGSPVFMRQSRWPGREGAS